MKNALLYLSVLLALGVWAGDWQFVSNKALIESSVAQSDNETLDSSSPDELELAVASDFVSPKYISCSGQVSVLTFCLHSANTYGTNLIRGLPSPVLSV